MSQPPRDAATVILVRERETSSELEVLLLCRHRGAGFMANAYVFPGGVAEPEDEGDLRVTAARELFEEGGVLLTDRELSTEERLAARSRVAAGEAAAAVLADYNARFSTSGLAYFAHWLTPSAERRRYSAQFFIANMPPGQSAQFDDVETVAQQWVTADEALERAKELRLPPPQVKTFSEMNEAARRGSEALFALAETRAAHRAIILPRLAKVTSPGGAPFALLLPWDRDYQTLGTGDAVTLPEGHPLACGPSRFVLEDETWKNIDAPPTSAATE